MKAFSTNVVRASLLACFVFTFSEQSQRDTVRVAIQVDSGQLEGTVETVTGGQNVEVYLGIPYAQPPVGNLRFAPPKPPLPWNGVRDATKFAANCPMTTRKCAEKADDNELRLPQSEDCLFLNVYKPAGSITDLPVMVWIHGGGFYIHAGMQYDGSVLASHNNVIVVSFNYRLGLLGFLNVLDTDLKGNYGMLDQVEVFRWVQRNIRHFGGNPELVTIFGESAGGASVDLHVLSPLSKGLFKYGIAESGFATSVYASFVPKNRDMYRKYLKELDCNNRHHVVDCLREKPLESILEAQGPTDYLKLASHHPIVAVDGVFLTKEPQTLMAEGNFNAEVVVLGMNSEEGDSKLYGVQPDDSAVPSKSDLDKAMAEVFFTTNGEGPLIKRAILQEYLNHTDPDTPDNILKTWSNIISDSWYFSRAIFSAKAYARHGVQTYLYQFSHQSKFSIHPAQWGVAHFDELQYVFGVPYQGNPNLARATGYTDTEKGLSSCIMRMWTNIAKYGNPNHSPDSFIRNKITWPMYTNEQQQYININLTSSVGCKLRPRRMAFWNDFVPQLKEIEEFVAVQNVPASIGHKDEL